MLAGGDDALLALQSVAFALTLLGEPGRRDLGSVADRLVSERALAGLERRAPRLAPDLVRACQPFARA